MSNDNNRITVQASAMEPNNTNESLEAKEVKGHASRVSICVTSYRQRKHDPDGVSVKAVLDGLVRRGILEDDSVKEIESIKFKSIESKEEKTIIEIIALEEK